MASVMHAREFEFFWPLGQSSWAVIVMSRNAKAWNSNMLNHNKNPVELKQYEVLSSYTVFYQIKLKPQK